MLQSKSKTNILIGANKLQTTADIVYKNTIDDSNTELVLHIIYGTTQNKVRFFNISPQHMSPYIR